MRGRRAAYVLRTAEEPEPMHTVMAFNKVAPAVASHRIILIWAAEHRFADRTTVVRHETFRTPDMADPAMEAAAVARVQVRMATNDGIITVPVSRRVKCFVEYI